MFDTTLDFILYPLGLLFTVMTIYNGYNGWVNKRIITREHAQLGEIASRYMAMNGYDDIEMVFSALDGIESCITRDKNGKFRKFDYAKFAQHMNDDADFMKQAKVWGTKIMQGQNIFKQEKQKQEND